MMDFRGFETKISMRGYKGVKHHSVLRTRMLHKPPPPCISLFSHVLLMSFGCKVDLLKAKPKKERGSESGFHTFPRMLCYQQEQT